MVETINRATVCAYHVAATQYCETEVQAKCVKWLERRLTSETSVSLLKEIRWDITLSRFTVLGSSRHYILLTAYYSLQVHIRTSVLRIL